MNKRETALYSLAEAAGSIMQGVFLTYVIFFYTDELSASPATIGALWFGFSLWNAINDIIAGWLSDKILPVVKKRARYIKLLAIPATICFIAIWNPPSIIRDNQTILLLYFLLTITIFDTIQSFLGTNQQALFADLFKTKSKRAGAASIKQIINMGLSGVLVVLAPMLYQGGLGWTGMSIIIGIFTLTLYLFSLIGMQKEPDNHKLYGKNVKEKYIAAIKSRTFWPVFGTGFFLRMILATVSTTIPFYIKYTLQTEESYATIFMGSLVLSSIISLPIWQQIYRRYSVRFGVTLSLILAILCLTPLFFISILEISVIIICLVGFVVGGVIFSSSEILLAELIDDDYIRTGVKKDLQFTSLLGSTSRLPYALSGLFLGLALMLSNYDSELEVAAQPENVGIAVNLVFTIAPLIAMIGGLIAISRYPIKGKRLEKIYSAK
ncbi:MFS transporter [Candidatus Dojkabacteria bacterium]|nr:MFS transporter [Candidatus Dojkabacteria bacterium]